MASVYETDSGNRYAVISPAHWPGLVRVVWLTGCFAGEVLTIASPSDRSLDRLLTSDSGAVLAAIADALRHAAELFG